MSALAMECNFHVKSIEDCSASNYGLAKEKTLHVIATKEKNV